MKHRILILLTVLVLCVPLVSGLAEWYRFDIADPPKELERAGLWVRELPERFVISFLGDCTLGGEKRFVDTHSGFVQTVRREGMDYPFKMLRDYFTADDLTLVNLEGVLTDRNLKKVPKTFNFKGSTRYTQILSEGGVEFVAFANNHANDYGGRGYADTLAALDAAGIGAATEDQVLVYWDERIVVGFTASSLVFGEKQAQRLTRQVAALRELGCDLVIHSMHIGDEYDPKPTRRQRYTAECAARAGCDLVIGHHPHIVQGFEMVEGCPVLYSLGNGVFGGNSAPKDGDALMVQAEWRFGEEKELKLRIVPLTLLRPNRTNSYQPRPLSGTDAQRVFRKMKESTGVDVGDGEIVIPDDRERNDADETFDR